MQPFIQSYDEQNVITGPHEWLATRKVYSGECIFVSEPKILLNIHVL